MSKNTKLTLLQSSDELKSVADTGQGEVSAISNF
jgi:hypothetical protein